MLSVNNEVGDVEKFVVKWCAFFSLSPELQIQLREQLKSLSVTIPRDEAERQKKLQKELWLQQRKQEWEQQQEEAKRRKDKIALVPILSDGAD